MTDLPTSILHIMACFAPLFSRPVYKNGIELIVAHFLCTGKRTVTNLIKRLGKHTDAKFTKYFYVLRKAKWSAFESSRILFLLIIDRLLPKNVRKKQALKYAQKQAHGTKRAPLPFQM